MPRQTIPNNMNQANNDRNGDNTERNASLVHIKQSCRQQLICTLLMVGIVGCCLSGMIIALVALQSNEKIKTDIMVTNRRLDSMQENQNALNSVVQSVQEMQNTSAPTVCRDNLLRCRSKDNPSEYICRPGCSLTRIGNTPMSTAKCVGNVDTICGCPVVAQGRCANAGNGCVNFATPCP